MTDYTLEALIKSFEAHAQTTDNQCKCALERFKENEPNEQIPEWLENPFNLSRALLVMAQEIKMMRNRDTTV